MAGCSLILSNMEKYLGFHESGLKGRSNFGCLPWKRFPLNYYNSTTTIITNLYPLTYNQSCVLTFFVEFFCFVPSTGFQCLFCRKRPNTNYPILQLRVKLWAKETLSGQHVVRKKSPKQHQEEMKQRTIHNNNMTFFIGALIFFSHGSSRYYSVL